ncbi:MAG: PAS domain S-box protein, partial [Alphaproteobacteria bacterium]|nr:PAS domain S-box protein [Alphaproteobacteria bacterium]
AYEGRTLPLSYADISSLVSDVEKFKNDVSNVLESLSRRDTGRQDSVSALDQKHSFLMSSIVSMTVSGLGLIVLLLMKLRASDKLLQERRNLSSLLEPRMAAIETAMDGVAITDAQGRLRYVNQALTDYHGYAAPEMLTHLPWKTLYDEEQQKWFDEEVMPYLLHEGRWRGHCKGLRLDGTYFHQDVAIAALDDGGYVFVVRDYTDLLDSIMLSNRRLAAIEAAGDGIGIVDNKGRLTYINKALRELHGFSEVELSDYIGQDWSLIYTPKGQDDIKAHVIPALRQTGQWHGEAPILRKNGTVVSTELSLTMLPDGGFIGTARDISERKKAELEKEELQRQFYQAQKMEAIGRMAGGIAHDFNNILSSILGYAEFLIDDLDKETQQHGFARQIYNGGTQARKLVDQILAFSRRREGGMDVLSLADAVRDTVDMLRPVMPPSVRLQVDNDGGDNIVHANSTQISQALMNLCVNAIDAAEDSVDAAVSVTSETMVADDGNVPLVMLADHLPKADQEPLVTIISDKDGSTLLMSGSLQRGASYACVSVSDNGCGMDRTVMEHIFEPFFTTKPVDRGTGLGLAAVHGIVAGHRGGMTVRSKPGEGTTFTLYLPQTSEEKAQKQGFSTKVVMGGGQILVVDDQPDVAAIAAEMLTRLGYNVDMAAAGDAAIDLLRERPGHYDLVLSDYSMPEMTGVELAEHIHADFPGLPVVIMTGYGRKKLDKEMKDHPAIVTMIRKPLDRVVLSQVISRALKRSEAA